MTLNPGPASVANPILEPSPEPVRARILFVDDDPRVFQGVKRTLRPYDAEFELRGVADVAGAIHQARQWAPTVVVTDVRMPAQDGFDLLDAFRNDPVLSMIPIIMLTGSLESDLKRHALDRGAVDLLDKPVKAEDLLARLRSVVRLRRYQDVIRTENERLEGQVRARTAALERAHAEMVVRLALAGELRDRETAAHVCRVAQGAGVIGRTLGMDDATVQTLMQAAALHDIGKIGIPDAILRKPGPLTDAERTVMQSHCRIGWELLRADVGIGGDLIAGAALHCPDTEPARTTGQSVLAMAAEIALCHHEYWNGAGYPDGRSGRAIPLGARIVAVADVFEALCHRRPYKDPLDPDEAARIVRLGAGAQFDPDITSAFERVRPQVLETFARFRDPNPSHAPI